MQQQAEQQIAIEYPESDGMDMGETELHKFWCARLEQLLKWRYRNRQVYVGGNLMLYYSEGEPHENICPDVMVVKDCPPEPMRDTFKIWEEGRTPSVVFEVISRSTRQRDQAFKPALYGEIGIQEYFLYDPRGQFMAPALVGYQFHAAKTERLELDREGRLNSESLDATLHLDGFNLVICDRATGDELLTEAEDQAQARKTAEAEIAQLRKLLAEKSSDNGRGAE